MKIFKKLSLIFSVFLIAFFGEIAINLACGPEADPYDYYPTYFLNNVQGDEYASFAYNQMVYLYNDRDFETEEDVNGQEWGKYLGVKKDDVIDAMYDVDSATSVLLKTFSKQTFKKFPDSLRKNHFLNRLTKNPNASKYFRFTKSCEPYIAVNFDYWNVKQKDSAAMIQKGCDALDSINKVSTDNFLKLRYAFQAQRMFSYAGDSGQAESTYHKFIKDAKIVSVIKGWSLAIHAGTVADNNESAYLFSKVFNKNPEKRVLAYKNYRYMKSDVDEVLKLAKNNDEKATILAINGFGEPTYNLKMLKAVYKLSPKSLLNGALLVREVNKLEEKIIKSEQIAKDFPTIYYERWDNAINKDSLRNVGLSDLQNIKAFALQLANEKKYPQPELGTLTAAYLLWMEKKDALANTYIKKLNLTKLPERLKDQYRIIDLLIKARNIKVGNDFNENELIPTLKWLDKKRFAENSKKTAQEYYYNWGDAENRFTKTTRNFYQQILAPAYLKKGDTAKAALAMLKGDARHKSYGKRFRFKQVSYQTTMFWQKQLTTRIMARLAKYRSAKNRNGMDSLLAMSSKSVDKDDFYELYGTTYLREHKYDSALKMFDKISPKYKYFYNEDWRLNDSTYFSTPFIEAINDYPKNHVGLKEAFNKKSFAKEMLHLQKLTVSDKKNAAVYYYKMANAVYQTGYFGNSWFLTNYDWTNYDNNGPVNCGFEMDYKKAYTAKKWYTIARSLSKNIDFKAKCTFMLAKCEQQQIPRSSEIGYYIYDKDYKMFMRANINNPYFKELKLKYSKTPFYQTVLGDCSYLRDFITGK
ncbi:hypothetical protein ASU31_07655 [Pedobacter ginsenosidimutans]|uniref:Uncharacterized protein n=1 Tax=Pedobacter ginsenosidimutans TaxID=687842 RepID=A0A0T5VS37_9SPHI|nr:hypothetical protein [Pedobacter ginsenosidimutans]KRT16682.1 hypothetical protein ASU31_07655 [Pedobacter ginsenosidimutans]